MDYFHDGWFYALPGTGKHSFSVPPGTTKASFSIDRSKMPDGVDVSFTTGFWDERNNDPDSDEGDVSQAWIAWVNNTDERYEVPYKIKTY